MGKQHTQNIKTFRGEQVGKKLYNCKVRLTKNQYERLQFLAEQQGFKTISNFLRWKLFNDDVHYKLNLILEKLNNGVQENE